MIADIESVADVAGLTGRLPVEVVRARLPFLVIVTGAFTSGLENYVENLGAGEQELADGLRSIINVYNVAGELGLLDLK